VSRQTVERELRLVSLSSHIGHHRQIRSQPSTMLVLSVTCKCLPHELNNAFIPFSKLYFVAEVMGKRFDFYFFWNIIVMLLFGVFIYYFSQML
jgi:hypothetical protein